MFITLTRLKGFVRVICAILQYNKIRINNKYMRGLKEIAIHNERWIKAALSMCKDKDLAMDIVQDMYIKLSEKEEVTDGYVFITIKNLWADSFKTMDFKYTKVLNELDYFHLSDSISDFEPNDDEQVYLDRFKELPMRQQEFILESYDFSVRQIADKFNTNRMYVQRQIHKGIEYVLRDEYEKYSNSNLKHLILSDKNKF